MTLRLSDDRSGRIGGVCLLDHVGKPQASDKADQPNFVAVSAGSFWLPAPLRHCDTKCIELSRVPNHGLDILQLFSDFTLCHLNIKSILQVQP
jgi:hypothetical protein